ncbi:hypothetical protein SAMN04487936_11475 [Halobacillus dabanensis]|uniref:Uncharacterized protein n=1 Tax=Halobacillus dabanensis TaxID=240302 RepID=A0A1I3ZNY3_HALDA|nr:hypothetical protein [Halobacillus dabanensis]SFK45854.1 hypothetical protein SAMN04487936_11475 [Halobacillus dabanensis]
MKTYPLLITLLFMIISWAMGIYFLNVIYTSTIIVPLFNDFIWIRDYKGILGLTAVFSIITIPMIAFMYKKRNHLSKKKTWYSISIVTHLFWVGTLALQLKTILYNLGICH